MKRGFCRGFHILGLLMLITVFNLIMRIILFLDYFGDFGVGEKKFLKFIIKM